MEINPCLDEKALKHLETHKYASGTPSLIEIYLNDFYIFLSKFIPKASFIHFTFS